MVYILLGSGFEEAEALVTADVLRRADVPVTLAGIGGELITGAHGIAVRADAPVESVKLKEDDMVVLPGGMGGVASIEGSGPAMALIRQAGTDVRLRLAAICAAPTLLARARLLAPGVRAVCYPGMEGELERAGARPQMDKAVVVHNKLITSQAPGTAFDFALALAELLAGIPAACRLHSDLHYGA